MTDGDLDWCFAGCGRKLSAEINIEPTSLLSTSSRLYCSTNCFHKEMYLHSYDMTKSPTIHSSSPKSLYLGSNNSAKKDAVCVSPLFLASDPIDTITIPEFNLSFLNRPFKSSTHRKHGSC